MKNAYNQGLECDHGDEEGGDDGVSPKDVGHNIYILAHQVPHSYQQVSCLPGHGVSCRCLIIVFLPSGVLIYSAPTLLAFSQRKQ